MCNLIELEAHTASMSLFDILFKINHIFTVWCVSVTTQKTQWRHKRQGLGSDSESTPMIAAEKKDEGRDLSCGWSCHLWSCRLWLQVWTAEFPTQPVDAVYPVDLRNTSSSLQPIGNLALSF
jgi:hypothetical protein